MAKNVTENHNINTEEESYEFEDLTGIETNDDTKQQNNGEPKKETKKSTVKIKGNTLVLKGAASYLGCGLKFKKDVPTPVDDKAVYDKLLSTGLFVSGNE